jgi:methylenetetrahydrofolate dehydrogenase (NADP+)/methenyltetrahydrofolate cyclohydrolase
VTVISPKKDVDGFTPENVGKLAIGIEPYFYPATPQGILMLLDEYSINLEGADAVVVGRSNIVGKPMALMLLEKNATVTIAHSRTKNLKELTKEADVVVVAIGKAKFVTEDMVKEGAVIVDVGINRIDGVLYGDVDFENVEKKASYITPVPGGVGPLTIAMLLLNTVTAFIEQNK